MRIPEGRTQSTTSQNDGDHLRPLPACLRPRSGESTDSYVRRLARANHLKPSYLRGFLVGPPDWGQGKRPRADRLAAVTGRRLEDLERALPDLAHQKADKPVAPRRRFTRNEEKPALFAAIRRDAESGQWTIQALADRHHVSRRLIRQALDSPVPPPRKQRPVVDGPAKARVRPAIDAILAEYVAMHDGQLPTVRLVWEKLLDEHDMDVSYGTVHRFIATHPLKNPDSPPRPPKRTAGQHLGIPTQPFHSSFVQQHRALLNAVQRKPAEHGLDGTYASITAFVLGLDAGTSWHLLTGFHEWLVVRLGSGHDLPWPILVRHLAPGGWVQSPTPESDTLAVTALHQLLNEYLDQREHPDCLAKIFRSHQAWLATQSWYRDESPDADHINRDGHSRTAAADQIT
ncbi:TniQ family protein [Streptomyces chrestomyceticus]|uniref:TniQ family protein n=1 Tax=Streptomyces chrestomyceticus TaxID=68185 RepID=A0ABU7WVA4_9ACTN